MSSGLSVVIPTLNAAASLDATLDSLQPLNPVEIVISDGGSVDATQTLAMAQDCKLVIGPAGRGAQLARGAAEASGDWLLFLHADTLLTPAAIDEARAFIADADNVQRAAAFQLSFSDDHPAARRVERLANWRSRHLGLPYGDQGLLISRHFYDSTGGYADMPLMEDVEFIRRIGRQRLRLLDSAVTTSAIRYRRDGWLKRPAKNLTCLSLYFLGVSPERIARLYQ